MPERWRIGQVLVVFAFLLVVAGVALGLKAAATHRASPAGAAR